MKSTCSNNRVEYSPGKTPVSLLQEICTRKNISPKYELLQVEGAVHEPTFQYRLSLEYNETEFEQTGTGRSKKEAKHNTALSMLVSMEILPSGTTSVDGEDDTTVAEVDDSRGGMDSDLAGNPVGLLQELCMKMKHPPPTYEVHSEEGLPHERIFAMACHVGEHYVEIGKGKSKKLAKRQAAAVMAERLKNIPSETHNVYDFDEDDDQICRRLFAQRKTRRRGRGKGKGRGSPSEYDGTLLSKCQAIARAKFSQFHESIEDPVKILEELEDASFKVIYIDFDEVSTSNKFQCFVQITTDPPIVAIGEGVTREEAKVCAAHDAVNNVFLQLLSPC